MPIILKAAMILDIKMTDSNIILIPKSEKKLTINLFFSNNIISPLLKMPEEGKNQF